MAAPWDQRVTVVVISHNRQDLAPRAVARLTALPEQPPVLVVDNASDPPVTLPEHPRVRLVRLERNAGAAARTVGVCAATTPYVAFADDDSGWDPGALARAADHLDRDPRLAVVAARLLVGDGGRPDPVVDSMRQGAVGRSAAGPAVLGFLACAVVVRRRAFLAAGGFHPAFLVGGEESLLAWDLATAGWALAYAEDVVARHWPADHGRERRSAREVRNDCWTAWLRRPWPVALRRTATAARRAAAGGEALRGLLAAAGGLPWVLASRQVVPPDVEAALRTLERAEAALRTLERAEAAT